MRGALLCGVNQQKESDMTKRQYLKTCLTMPRAWLESVAIAYDKGNKTGMRPIHRALVGIALRR
jgi:hypothetical protein